MAMANESRDKKIALEKFQAALNREPLANEVQILEGVKYLPISYVEMLLDEMFFGLWETKDFRWQTMGNEVVGSVTLRVFHPVAEQWIERTGAAATQIRQIKGAAVGDFSAKIKNALEMDFPHLKADCLTSAARSLGKAFGRDLNRKLADIYRPIVHGIEATNAQTPERAALLAQIHEGLQDCTDAAALGAYFNQDAGWRQDAEIIALFTERKNQLAK